ncbi:ABC transporter ATP-binding protein/permease [Hungatella hathewayi]|nr:MULTISPECIES: ABC transporter ATP-binding protein [Hungatella]MBS6757893.1 ABC transporter ATP-binding protein [Hungatella hathewayi]MCI6455620.1 ABC transporter ATP-binding protein/permease [Hungatella sp.]MCI7383986.1 ABC transporter ATP-binding protein/permease [Hungatella sp.]MCQ4827817.1 ABC transporter ATP-binding protein/permease [Hungatella sp. SL.1.14]MCQ5384180.1 ABC transporter ATP-binding protein/permease [Hungatella hathewayi]
MLGKLKPFLAPYSFQLFVSVFMIVISIAAITAAPRIEGMITSRLAADVAGLASGAAGARIHFEVIRNILLVLLSIYLIKTVSQIVGAFCLTNSIQNAMHDLRNEVQNKIRRLPVRYFDTNSFGDVLSRVTNDVEAVSNALQQSFSQVISGILTLVLALWMMFSINRVMACIACLIIPVGALITRGIVKISQSQFKAQQDSLGDMNGAITELYTGYNEILLFGQQEQSRRQFETVNDSLQKHAFKAQFLSSLMSPLISLTTYLSIGIIAVIGCFAILAGTLSVGNLQAFIRYIWQVNDPLTQVSQLSAQIQAAFAGLKRIFEILDEPEETESAPAGLLPGPAKGEVTFEHVSFSYGDTPVIRDFNVTVKSGQMVAIVGPTGAGKTTLINLLLRFYDVNSGRILVDGVDIRDMNREDLRSMFGMVLQDTWLFSGTIFDNIRYGNLSARKDEVIDAAKMANVHHFIRTLPQGYNMVINEEGSNISQGEKQLLTIARAILKNPQIMILDEATSSVDTRLEKMLQSAMYTVLKDRTSFVIAHRLSTIKNADLILVLRDGDIAEMGNHESLMAQNGFYSQLYNSQFAWGAEEA